MAESEREREIISAEHGTVKIKSSSTLVHCHSQIAMDKEEVELPMNAKYELELIHRAIQQLIEEKRAHRSNASVDCFLEDDDQLLLSRLLSQLDLSMENTAIGPPKPASEMDVLSAVTEEEVKDKNVSGSECENREMGPEAILRELRKVKRQNSITHWLLSIMIFLTATWHLSEVSFIMIVKNKLSNPFRIVGSAVKGMLAIRGKMRLMTQKTSSRWKPLQSPVSKSSLPHVGLPALGLNGDDV
ncbi:hypothetical protein NE237_005617 [Protea cynaroides]|uniref:Uncharacterized protein n=1 Tax=Protea cynaroides TaxID=273540 RepID=A0A9Q0KKR9_9MAGN|nr:hypothetical protein NE237_005617 [Protea cynaroides]